MANDNLLDLDIVLRLPQPKDFAEQLRREAGSALSTGLLDAVKQYEKQQMKSVEMVNQKLATLALKNLKSGMGTDELGKIAENYSKILQEKGEIFIKMKSLEEKLAGARSEDEKKLFQQQLDHAKAIYAMRGKEAQREYSQIIKQSIDASKEQYKAIGEGFSDSIVGGLDKISSGDLEGLFSKISEGASNIFAKGAQALAGRAESARAAGKSGAGLDSAANVLGTLSKVAGAMTVAVGAFAALAVLFGKMDEQFKTMNKHLIENAGAAELMNNQYGTLTENLSAIRDVVSGAGLNMMLGTTAEELNQLVASIAKFGSQNQVLQTMGTEQEMRNSLRFITAYSRLTGESLDTMSTSFLEYGERMGQSLEDVARGFSGVLRSAVNSGVGVNRFQTAVFQATANTALYNKRLEETANLLDILTDVVDLETATGMLTSTGGQYEGLSMQDRLQVRMTTNRGVTDDLFSNEFSNYMSDLGADQRGEILVGLRNALGDPLASLEDLIERAAGLTGSEYNQMVANPALGGNVREIMKILDLYRASQGGRDAQLLAMDLMSNTGSFTYRMAQGRQVLGMGANQSINDASLEQLMALQQNFGFSAEEVRNMRTIEPVLRGQYDTVMQAARLGDTDSLSRFGLTLGEGGEVLSADGETINSFTDFMMQREDAVENMINDLNENVMTDTDYLREISENTLTFGDVIQTGVTAILQDIYSWVAPLAQSVMGWILGENEQGAVRDQVREENQRISDELSTVREEIRSAQEARSEMEDNSPGAETMDAFIEELSGRVGQLQEMRQAVGGVSDQTDMNQYLSENRNRLMQVQNYIQRLEAGIEQQQAVLARLPSNDPNRDIIASGIEEQQETLEHWQENLEELQNVQDDGNKTTEEVLAAIQETNRLQQQQINLQREEDLRNFLVQEFGQDLATTRFREASQGDLSNFSADQQLMLQTFGIRPRVNDFIYQSNGANSRITPINSQDSFYGAKPGGPIAGAVGSASGPVTINVYGATGHDMVRVLDTYVRVKGIQSTRPGKRT